MYKYELIIYWSEEDQSYLIEVPELPGCLADGETYQKALANVELLLPNGLKQQESQAGRYPNLRVDWLMPNTPQFFSRSI